MEADPSVVLEWLGTRNSDNRFLQHTALEQLCNDILFCDNVDTFSERYAPGRFVPALLNIFLDAEAPVMVLEANARAVSYFLDMHKNWCQEVVKIPGILPALTSHLDCLDMSCPTSNEFGQQLIKLLKIVCYNVSSTLSTDSLLTSLLQFLCNHADKLHSDVRQAGLDTMCKLFSHANPEVISDQLPFWIQSLADLLEYNQSGVADQALQAFSNLVSRFARCGADPTPLASPYIIEHLLRRLRIAGGVEGDSGGGGSSNNNPAIVQAITNILITLCSCGSTLVVPFLLNSRVPLACTLAMVLQRSENPPVLVLSILRFVKIILILLYQSPNVCDSDKKKHPQVGDPNEVVPSVCPIQGSDGREDDTSTAKEQVDDKTPDHHITDASELQAQALDGTNCPVKKSEISYQDAQHTFVHQLFPVVINLFNETACPAVKHQCILLATRFVTCLTAEDLEEISLSKFHSVTFAFSLTQVVYSVCTEEADEIVLYVLKLSQCLLLKAPHIYTVVFRRLGLRPLFDQLADIWAHLCHRDPSAEPRLPVRESTSNGATSILRVWHGWYFVRLEEHVCIFSKRAVILLQASSRGVGEDGKPSTDGSTGLCALALHTGSGQKSGGSSSTCTSVVLLPNRPLLHRPSLKARLLQIHRQFLEKVAGDRSDVAIIDLMSTGTQSVTANPELPSHHRQRRHTESGDCWQTSASPLVCPSIGSDSAGSGSSGFSKLLSKATLHRAGKHLGLRRTPRPAYSPSPDNAARSCLLQRQASSPARSCLPRIPRKASPAPDWEEVADQQLENVSIGPFYFCLREAGTHGTCLCVQLSKYMNTKSTREALLFFENDTLGFTRVRISPLQGVDRVERSRQLSQSEPFVGQEGSAANPEENAHLPHRRRYSASLIDILSELDKEFTSPGTPSAAGGSGETLSSSFSTWHTDFIDIPELFDLDILFGIGSATAADDITCSVPAEDTSLTSFRCRRLSSEPSQIVRELYRLRDLLFPSELVYETYSSGRLKLQLQPPTAASRTRTTSMTEKSKQEKLCQTRRQAHKLTVRLSRFLSVPVEKWQGQLHHDHRRVAQRQLEPASDPLVHLRQVVADIVAAYLENLQRPLGFTSTRLSTAFRRLARLLTGDREQVITAYELTISGLVPALLLCLSVSNACRWTFRSSVSGMDLATDLLWCLHERRQLFLHSLSTSAVHSGDARVSPLSNLIRGLVQAFELADHLPLCLHALTSQPTTPSPSTDFKWILPECQFFGNPGSFDDARQDDGTHQAGEKVASGTYRPLASLPVGVIKAAVADSRPESDQNRGTGLNRLDSQHLFSDCLDGGDGSALTRIHMNLSRRLNAVDCCPIGMHQVDGWFSLTLERLHHPAGDSVESASLFVDSTSPASLKVNPLVTVGQLRRVLEDMTMHQWYDQPRSSLPYWRQIESAACEGVHLPSPLLNGNSCPLEHLGGVLDWLGTNAGRLPLDRWCNPASIGLVSVASSAVRRRSCQPLSVLGPRAGSLVGGYPVSCTGFGAVFCQQPSTGQQGRHLGRTTIPAWFAVDLGLQLTPTAYSLAYLRRTEAFSDGMAPRNWRLDASNDAVHWTLMSSHQEESLQSTAGSRATWSLEALPEQKRDGDGGDTENVVGWRYFRIVATGLNACGRFDLALGGLEFYGTVHAVHPEVMAPAEMARCINSDFAKATQSQSPARAKTKVRRSQKGHAPQSSTARRKARGNSKDDASELLGFFEDDESLQQHLDMFTSNNEQIPSVIAAAATTEGATADSGSVRDSPPKALGTQPVGAEEAATSAKEDQVDSDSQFAADEVVQEEGSTCGTSVDGGTSAEGDQGSPTAAPAEEAEEGEEDAISNANCLRLVYLLSQQPSFSDIYEDFGDAIEAIIQNNVSLAGSEALSAAFTTDKGLDKWKTGGVSDDSDVPTPAVVSDSEVPTTEFTRITDSATMTTASSGHLKTRQPAASKHSAASAGRAQARRRPRRSRPLPFVEPLTLNSSSSGVEPETAVSSNSSNVSTLTSGTCSSYGAAVTAPPDTRSRQRRLPLTWIEAMDTLLLPPGLIPVFNPNPGTTNALATTPFTLLADDFQACRAHDRLTLVLMVVCPSGCIQQVPLLANECTLFKYVQYLSELFDPAADVERLSGKDAHGAARFSLKLGYREWHPDDVNLVTWSNHHLHSPHSKTGQRTLLSPTDLRLTPSLHQPVRLLNASSAGTIGRHVVTMAEGMAANDDFFDRNGPDSLSNWYRACHPEMILDLLGLLHQLSGASEPFPWHEVALPSQQAIPDQSPTVPDAASVSLGDFLSPRLSKKLMLQLRDPLAVASGALPDWCFTLTRSLRPLFSFDVRLDFLRACAFGPARAVIWLQNLSLPTSFGSTSSSPSLSRQMSNSRNTLLTVTLASLPRSFRDILTSPSTFPAVPASFTTGNSPQQGELTALEETVNLEEYYQPESEDADHDPSELVLLTTGVGTKEDPLVLTVGEGDNLSQSSDRDATSADKNKEEEGEGLMDRGDSATTRPASTLVVSGDHREPDHSASQETRETPTTEAGSGDSWLLDFAARLVEQHSDRKSELGAQLLDEDDEEFPMDIFTSLLLATNSQQLATTSPNASGSGGCSGRHWTSGRIGRLHKEFVRIPRLSREVLATDSGVGSGGDQFWEWAARLMEQHASQKSELEIQFLGEDGTGIGPTLEFYSLLLAELRKKSTQMWVTVDDNEGDRERVAGEDVDEEATVAPGDKGYVNSEHGLFPAPWPADSVPAHVLHRFYILGITIAKCLQDNRRIDLPLSMPFLKLLSVYGNISYGRNHCCAWDSDAGAADAEPPSPFPAAARAERVLTSIAQPRVPPSDSYSGGLSELGAFMLSPQYRRVHHTLVDHGTAGLPWSQDILDLGDLCQVYPDRAYFFRQVMEFSRRKCLLDKPSDKELEALFRDVFGESIGDLCLDMEFLPTSRSLQSCPLLEWYSWEDGPGLTDPLDPLPQARPVSSRHHDEEFDVSDSDDGEVQEEVEELTVHNLDVYLTRMLAFCLDKGIRRQLEAFRVGFERVLPLSWLSLFNASELSQLICGESLAQWTRADLLAYTVPALGFTAQSPTYRMLINVLADFSLAERRAFLQFTTGCSSLPYGGLKNLQPRLTVVCKDVSSGGVGAALPSVNTCVHYLKLPEYQSEEELRNALLRANREVGFYLN